MNLARRVADPDADRWRVPPQAGRRRKVGEIFTSAEILALTKRSNWRGAWAVASTWGVVALAFAAMAWAAHHLDTWQAAIVVLAGMVVIAGRQLALAILMHEASHGTLFKTKWCNDVLVDWLCARPIWNDLAKYRVHHLQHHSKTGSAQDTDISLVAPFPTTRASLMRKFLRDLTGLTGLKFLLGRLLMDAGILKWTIAQEVHKLPQEGRTLKDQAVTLVRNITPMVLTNLALWGALHAYGEGWLYGVWVLSYLTPFTLFVRIRSMAEHACTSNSRDTFFNTRTTRAGWLARATVAPMRVHFHIEHHVMASVPYYRLKTMHGILRQRGLVPAPPGYWDVLKLVSSKGS
ncbi:MAG: fatty acid desaturase family protein [Acidobacteriota bacterium]